MKILITSGGTEEPVDGVRYITNFSTGQTGATIADRLDELGANVLLLHGHRAVLPERNIKTDDFRSFNDLDQKLKKHLRSGEFDSVIHLAAVSDFFIDAIETEDGKRFKPGNSGKLESNGDIKLHLKKNYKILNRLKSYNPPEKNLVITGFKLTNSDSREIIQKAVDKILNSGNIDYLVQNNLKDITKKEHPAKIYSSDGQILFETDTKKEIAERLFSLLKEKQQK